MKHFPVLIRCKLWLGVILIAVYALSGCKAYKAKKNLCYYYFLPDKETHQAQFMPDADNTARHVEK